MTTIYIIQIIKIIQNTVIIVIMTIGEVNSVSNHESNFIVDSIVIFIGKFILIN